MMIKRKPVRLDTSQVGKNSGWVSPDGTWYECGYMEHVWLARRLFKEGITKDSGEWYLEENGWLKLKSPNTILFFSDVPMTRDQKNFIYDFIKGLDNFNYATINMTDVSLNQIYEHLEKEQFNWYVTLTRYNKPKIRVDNK